MENEKVVMILEDMRSDFRAFKEGLSGIRELIDETNSSLAKTNKRLDDAINFLQNMMFEHEKWLQEHEVRLKTVERKVA